jgi:hypothetical protein
MTKIQLNASVAVDLDVTSLKGETAEEILAKLKSGDYIISLFGDKIYDTAMCGEVEGEVATIDDKDIINSDYEFEIE